MEEELLKMAAQWRKTALEEMAKCAPASRAEFANQMLLACAEMLEFKIKNPNWGEKTSNNHPSIDKTRRTW